MKLQSFRRFVLPVVAVCLMWAAGCDENDLSNASFFITPDPVTLTEDGESVVLTAVGSSEPLVWSVSDPQMGTVSGGGRSVTYTRTTKVGANTVTVTSSEQWTASARIIQEDQLGGLAIAPTQVTVSSAGDRTVFTVTGGTKPYAWSLGNDTGSIAPTGQSQGIYTRFTTNKQNNSVIVIDQAGRAVQATITQP